MSRFHRQSHIAGLLAVLFVLAVLLGTAAPVSAAEAGECGDQLTWSLEEGKLTISGTGAMWNFREPDMAPWYVLRDQITELSLPEGLTNIGALAFYDLSRLTTVDLPGSVTDIGEYAFASCEAITLLDLGDSLTEIGTAAFYSCRSLVSLRLPDSLQRIGRDAFYDCRALAAITVPANVQSIGSAAFAYCTSLLRAEFQNSMTVLPEWAFFGCIQLSTVILPSSISSMGNAAFRNCDSLYYVSYGGDAITKETLEDTITQDVPQFGFTGCVTPDVPTSSTSTTVQVEKEDGSVVVQNNTVTQGTNSTVSSTVEHKPQDTAVPPTANITITVENDNGWQEALEALINALENIDRQTTGKEENTHVTVYVKDSDTVDQELVNTMAGRDVTVTVVTKTGATWKIDCSTMDKKVLSGAYDLRYTLVPATVEQCQQMGAQKGYLLRFLFPAEVDTEIMIRLTDSLMQQNATLFQQKLNSTTLIQHQSVIIDTEGYAHFYLGSVTDETDYFIGINVKGVSSADAIVPDTLLPQYGGAEPVRTLDYVITGRTSSWGMTGGQVTWILAGVMVGSITIIGFVMFILNKRKLKAGYIPNLEDET